MRREKRERGATGGAARADAQFPSLSDRADASDLPRPSMEKARSPPLRVEPLPPSLPGEGASSDTGSEATERPNIVEEEELR